MKIDTRLEKEKFSICLKLTFLFSNKISIFNIATVNPPPKTGLTTYVQGVLGVQGRIFKISKPFFFAIINIWVVLTFMAYDLFGSDPP